MHNISLETSSFSEQLGLYDFFNVLISGAVFVFSIISISVKIKSVLLPSKEILVWLGLVLVIYISGVVLQEISSMLDHHFLKIKHFTRSTFLFDLKEHSYVSKVKYWFSGVRTSLIETMGQKEKKKDTYEYVIRNGQQYKWNWVLNNKNLLSHYRILAKQIYEECLPDGQFEAALYNDEKFNSFVFSVIQYRVACEGKDKKVEKLRALYSLARTLMFGYILLFGFNFILIFGTSLRDWIEPSSDTYVVAFTIFSIGLAVLFFFRAKKCKKYMALIMLGNYDAIQSSSIYN